MAELDHTGKPKREYIYLNGQPLAMRVVGDGPATSTYHLEGYDMFGKWARLDVDVASERIHLDEPIGVTACQPPNMQWTDTYAGAVHTGFEFSCSDGKGGIVGGSFTFGSDDTIEGYPWHQIPGNPMYYAHYGMDGALESAPGGTELYYIHNDHLGTPQAVTTSAANPQVAWSATYDPFGKATVAAGSSITMNLRFPGQYYDGETGLHYNYFRTYDPSTGRYLESDPIGLQAGLNTYAYAHNNPNTWIDLILPRFPGHPVKRINS